MNESEEQNLKRAKLFVENVHKTWQDKKKRNWIKSIQKLSALSLIHLFSFQGFSFLDLLIRLTNLPDNSTTNDVKALLNEFDVHLRKDSDFDHLFMACLLGTESEEITTLLINITNQLAEIGTEISRRMSKLKINKHLYSFLHKRTELKNMFQILGAILVARKWENSREIGKSLLKYDHSFQQKLFYSVHSEREDKDESAILVDDLIEKETQRISESVDYSKQKQDKMFKDWSTAFVALHDIPRDSYVTAWLNNEVIWARPKGDRFLLERYLKIMGKYMKVPQVWNDSMAFDLFKNLQAHFFIIYPFIDPKVNKIAFKIADTERTHLRRASRETQIPNIELIRASRLSDSQLVDDIIRDALKKNLFDETDKIIAENYGGSDQETADKIFELTGKVMTKQAVQKRRTGHVEKAIKKSLEIRRVMREDQIDLPTDRGNGEEKINIEDREKIE